MLKKISVSELRTGMYLHELCGSWMEHPFWRTGFVIDDPHDLQRITDSGVREAWIDSAKGLDVASGQHKEHADAAVEDRLVSAASAPVHAVERASMAEEVERAAKICAQARQAVVSMFQEARMGRTVEADQAMPLVEEISASVLRNPGALISLARLKTADDYTYMHSVAVCALMIALARQLQLDAATTREAGLAGLLHDIGKIAIPTAVLNKPGKLTDTEFATVKEHPVAGHRMLLGGSGVGAIALDVCLHHHEKVDGSGYPEHLAGDAISVFARMGAVCDVYDAITSDRPYKRGWDPAEALRKMTEWSRGHFDERIFQAFVKSVGIYPVGALVRLKSGRLGVVVDQSEKSLLSPKVKVFFSLRADARIVPEIVDLGAHAARDAIAGREDPEKWNFPDLVDLWRGGQAAV
jgi:HD-GYP domain-containing protein (c-di-GMP phosphodiesterase class II)